MARILVDSQWYESLASNAFLEDEYEKLILSQARHLFPDFLPVRFNRLIESEHGTKRPDFALIDKTYCSWWVVEVELAHHSLHRHVLPQVTVFLNASFSSDDADYLLQQDSSLDGPALHEMMRGEQPGVVVIVSTPSPTWVSPLHSSGALLTVAEVFRSQVGKIIIRLNGDYPAGLQDVELLTGCRFDPVVPTFLIVKSPARLPTTSDNRYWIEFEGNMTEWARCGTSDTVWLSPARGVNPIPNAARHIDLFQLEDDRLMFRVE